MTPRRIFVRSPNWVGDAVMATPALRALRAAHPDAEIVLEARPLLADLWSGLPTFDAFLPDARGSTLTRARALRARGFDWAVLLPDSVRVALAPFLARIPRRVGYARDLARRALLTDALDPPREGGRRLPISMIERYLAITRHLGCEDRGTELDLRVEPELVDRVESRLGACGVGREDAILVVTPGARFGSSKLWPPDHFASACDGIAQRLGLLPVFAPAPDEIPIAETIAQRMKERSLVLKDPPATIAELKALIARCALALTNDAGPRHIAVALSRPVVVVMGPTDPRHTAHHLERQRVLREDVECSPCHLKTCPIDHRCMTRLRPERAVRAALELLA
ncbi:MAG: lipopolysaccharide heptosyltransferase II [Deltaproteobacteria bacterium]|nr:MAG: lipopolysaccharide heptosyltransferase II [Deltaproteobacteria bacterium]